MKQTIRISILIALYLFIGRWSKGQESENFSSRLRIESIARSYSDSIVLRWAPNDPALWLLTNDYGYHIIRSYLNSEGVYHSEQVTTEPLMPWSLERMMETFGPADTLAAVVAEVLYGDGFIEMEIDDEGGSFVHSLVKQQRNQEMRYSIALQAADFRARIADALALRFVDTNVQQGVLYTYLIESLIPGEAAEVQNSTEIVLCEPWVPRHDTLWLESMQNDNQTILLSWRRNHCSAFYIERSDDNGGTWSRLNREPYYSSLPDENLSAQSESLTAWYDHLRFHHIFSDSLESDRSYLYRVQGIDAFADLTPYSEVLEVALADITPPTAPLMLQPEILQNDIVTISWLKEPIEEDLAGFYIQFSPSIAGPYSEVSDGLLPPATTTFTDENGGRRGAGYYRVIAIDTEGNQSMSFPVRSAIEDLVPPSQPTGLNGIIYADAVAEIYWNPNPEPDIKGYRVYYANQADHTFVPLTPAPINQTWYRDTINLKTLTRNIYYQVFAEDFAGNMSQVSDILELTRPDIVPPPVAVALDARQDEENVYISWAASPANDVLGYRIFRKPSNSEDWEMVKMIRHEEVEGQIDFVDKPPPAPTPWHYTMEVIDEAGLSSGISKVISFRVRGKREINIPVIMNARFDETSGSIHTTWEYNYREPHHVVLYRSINGAASTAVRSLESTVKTFSDKTLISSTEVSYHLLIVLPDGRTSLPSETVTVRIP